jgi:hypothetical protein
MKPYFAVLCIISLFLSRGAQAFWGFANSRLPRILSLHAGKPVDVTFTPSGKVIVAEQGDLIEVVAKKAGVVIPFKCKQGRCMSCEVRLNGKVSTRVCQGATIPSGPTKKLTIDVINKKPL